MFVPNPTPVHPEGDFPGMTIVIEFEDMNAARRFCESDAYTAAGAVRETSADTDPMLVEGIWLRGKYLRFLVTTAVMIGNLEKTIPLVLPTLNTNVMIW